MTGRRILLLNTDLEIGGTPTVVRELAVRLSPFAHVEVACLKRRGPVAGPIESAGIPVTTLDTTAPWHLPRAVGRLRGLIRERGIDTILSFLVHANAIATLAVRHSPGVRLVQSIQTVQPSPRWHWWTQRWAAGRADAILAPSTAIVSVARRRSGIAADRFVVIPNAVDPAGFSPSPVFARPRVHIGFIGRIDPVKRIDVAIRAAASMRDVDPKLLIFGDGPDRRSVQAWQAEKFPDAGRIEWRGAIDRPQEALEQIDVLILPSIGEGFGLVLIEAMAAGVPVVASSAGGILDVVRHERNGLLVPVGPGEINGFAESIRRLRDDVELRRRLIDGGYSTVHDRFNWGVVLPSYRELLRI